MGLSIIELRLQERCLGLKLLSHGRLDLGAEGCPLLDLLRRDAAALRAQRQQLL